MRGTRSAWTAACRRDRVVESIAAVVCGGELGGVRLRSGGVRGWDGRDRETRVELAKKRAGSIRLNLRRDREDEVGEFGLGVEKKSKSSKKYDN